MGWWHCECRSPRGCTDRRVHQDALSSPDTGVSLQRGSPGALGWPRSAEQLHPSQGTRGPAGEHVTPLVMGLLELGAASSPVLLSGQPTSPAAKTVAPEPKGAPWHGWGAPWHGGEHWDVLPSGFEPSWDPVCIPPLLCRGHIPSVLGCRRCPGVGPFVLLNRPIVPRPAGAQSQLCVRCQGTCRAGHPAAPTWARRHKGTSVSTAREAPGDDGTPEGPACPCPCVSLCVPACPCPSRGPLLLASLPAPIATQILTFLAAQATPSCCPPPPPRTGDRDRQHWWPAGLQEGFGDPDPEPSEFPTLLLCYCRVSCGGCEAAGCPPSLLLAHVHCREHWVLPGTSPGVHRAEGRILPQGTWPCSPCKG